MTVRLKDIAEKAKVDVSSVSRILRDDPRAGELRVETRERVLRLAKEMGYRRNISAATIRNGINRSTIALVCDPTNTDSPRLLFDLMNYLSDSELAVRCYTGHDMDKIYGEIAANQIPYVINNQTSYKNRLRAAELARKYGMKMVFFTSIAEFPDFSVFDDDNAGSMTEMVHYLHARGHSRIVMICGDHARHNSTEMRHAGFIRGMRECSLPCSPDNFWCAEFDRDGVLDFLERTAPSAICTIDGSVAMDVSLALERAGVLIPRDVSLITFGDNMVLSHYANPPVTAFNDHVGYTVIRDVLHYLLDTPDGYCCPPHFYKAHLVERASVFLPNPHSQLKQILSQKHYIEEGCR